MIPDKKTDLHILGGGPAGLASAYYAHNKKISFQLFESTNEVGGNCRTIKSGDFMYDTGAHRLHDKNSKVTKDIKSILGEQIKEVSAPSKIFYNNQLIDFPIRIADIVKKVGLKINLKIIKENIQNKFTRNKEVHSFKDLAYKKYGKTLSDLFLINYTEKLWGQPSEHLASSISGGRLKNLDFYSVFKEMISGKVDSRHIDGNFLYPEYGFGAIFSSMEKLFNKSNILLKSPVKKLIHKNNKIEQLILKNNHIINVENVISTLPLPILINSLTPSAPNDIKKIINEIQYRSLKAIVLFLNQKKLSDNASIYFPEKEIPFTRIYEPKNRSKKMAPKKQTCVVIEVPIDNFSNDNSKNINDNIYKSIKSILIKKKIIKENNILRYEVLDMPFAYPILNTKNPTNIVFKYLESFNNLKLLGRSAEFKYLHVHDLFYKASKIINKIK